MKEIRAILDAYERAQRDGKRTALATVVRVDGSSYRRPGARMLVTDEGRLTGAISGGCLEGDALRKALSVIMQQKPRLVTYDTTDEDDAKLGVGLGCHGIIHILIEPIDDSIADNPVHLLRRVLAQRQNAVLVTLFDMTPGASQPGTCMLRLQNGQIIGKIPVSGFEQNIYKEIGLATELEVSRILDMKESTSAFIEFLQPDISLVIAGAGNDIIPLVEMASILGWQVTVADGRCDYATPLRFPLAQSVIISKPGNLLDQVQIDDQTVFVLMTHNYNYDLALLRELMKKTFAYAGILGPKKKTERLISELQQEGNWREESAAKIFGPVGLNIGAETPEEIALSIIAEIKAVLSKKDGGFLKNRQGSIHAGTWEEKQQESFIFKERSSSHSFE
ncbi:MAG: alanine dehydrogenase [Bacteroidetes bacterium]|nr:MAG: alanine dehydrogenase [Bacteroidota bacterium]